ncbi:hypothetical protein O181_012045 [Austropuccinia psidii MF-1]|uniref:Uncharacterized protein n=1 Tax=Austropuccinia psidii MF-1 TaxID=1389203 RepID=A0A9Q3GMI5_9BASI|nr:hypothetical protein [Austropuccinia psidii MF-1]
METPMSSFISKIKCIEDGSTLPPESGIMIGNTSLLPKCKNFSKKKIRHTNAPDLKLYRKNQREMCTSASNQNPPNLNPSSIAASPIPVSSNSEILSSCSSVIPLACSCIDNIPHLNQKPNDTPCLNLPTSPSLYSILSHNNQ